MRIWDIPPNLLCSKHLLAEHSELHAIWNILTKGKRGYSQHPETKRWKGKLRALYKVHDSITKEMLRRGYKHNSLLDKTLAKGNRLQSDFVDPVERQVELLREKGCQCNAGTDYDRVNLHRPKLIC